MRAAARAPVAGLAVVASALLAVACASTPRPAAGPGTYPGAGPGTDPGGARPATAGPEDLREQRLYRLVYDGGEGRVGLRVVLRVTAGARYQIAVSDVAGRAVWGLDYAPDRVILVDHRERLYCVAGPELRLTDVHPAELPLAALPRVLRGELPVTAPPGAGDEFTDAAGRRWRRQLADGALGAWTLYDAGEPSLWWTRQEDGGILSRRGGEQYRWTEVVAEAATGALPHIVPAGFTEGTCSD